MNFLKGSLGNNQPIHFNIGFICKYFKFVFRSPSTALNSLAPFLPRPGPTSHLYPSMRPGAGTKSSSRPYSADVGRLISVAEDAEVRSHKSGHSGIINI